MIERAAAARRASLDSLFVGDQHASPTPYYQNTPMLGRLLAEWGEKPAGCLFLLPLWHLVLVAEQIGTLAAIARGPFTMQCGLSWGDARFAAMGANVRTWPSAFEEALDIVRCLLAGETVSSSGRFRIAEARLALRPAEPVEIWVGANAPPAIDRAARLAEGWIASPGLNLDEARVQADMYCERCAAYGGSVAKRGMIADHPARRPRHIKSGGNPEQLDDEGRVCPHVTAVDLPNLPLSDHRHCLEARQYSSRRPEAAKAEPRTGQALDTSVVLLQNVVQVFHLA
jgi:alkanesulfonate monooxygenase SsuD/methylene tetrahydromethanopterin reductase-like flavin-dependent oxidoreductase (luciferase family)